MFDDNVLERYSLAIERIAEINSECEIKNNKHKDYFNKVSAFILLMDKLKNDVADDAFNSMSLEELSEYNHRLYEDVADSAYDTSYANPRVCAKAFGEDAGKLMAMVYMELRALIVYMYEKRLSDATSVIELFIELYCIFVDNEADAAGRNNNAQYTDSTVCGCEASDIIPDEEYRQLGEAVYWYVSDYSDDYIDYRIRELLDPSLDFATKIIMESDLSDVRYLYKYGEYVTDNELKMARHLNTLSEEAIQDMARTFTEGYRIGFVLGNKPLDKKKTVNIRYCLGFERLVRAEIEQFEKMGLKPTIYRAAVNTINKKMHIKIGYYGASPNKQMEFDHRFDNALYLDGDFVERKLGALKSAYEKYSELAAVHGGPAVMEVFGETPFEPEDTIECCHLDDKQQKLLVKYNNESGSIINSYIKGEERSFTIIAYPSPQIGDKFPEIFNEIVKINTLDYEKYKVIQQNIINVLDKAEYVEVHGQGANETDMKVSIMKVNNPDKETVFENCLADVNIPLGEVFTSPVLKGTEGVLNVSSVYLNDIKFNNLKVYFKDGFVIDYSCDNFEDGMKGKALFKENVLYNHDTLPIGEFAIGTNTTAYVMANKYDIVYLLPILIVEKMGPHFAIGDTCYSRSEDVAVYNPDGKEIISRDNEVSLLRKTEPDKAYFNCHTDITIPYEEIGDITVVGYDGERTAIIKNGRFVLDGTKELNEPFEE
uniref:aminopeptidase n=1 Tax=Lachnospira sp. TaxID=2049031 RepID=UPI003FF01E78